MKHLDLFSGIGGFALAAEEVWPGIEHTFVEIDPFCQAVLKKHWPKARIYGDIKTVTGERLAADADLERELQPEGGKQKKRRWIGHGVDLLTGGFPCQPFSVAGKRRGSGDDRHLWPEMFRLIRETAPRYVVAENVRGLITQGDGLVFEGVCADLEDAGYDVQPFIVPACAIGAPHRRDRVWIAASHASSRKGDGRGRNGMESASAGGQGVDASTGTGYPNASDSPRGGRRQGRTNAGGVREDAGEVGTQERRRSADGRGWSEPWPQVAIRLCVVDDGFSRGLVRLPDGTDISRARWRREALKGAGNAIVPQVAVEIMKAIDLSTRQDSSGSL